MLTGVAWLTWSFLWWQQAGILGGAVVMSLVTIAGGLAIIVLSTGIAAPRLRPERLDFVIIAGTLFVIGVWLLLRAPVHGYGTDEITTGQASAVALLQGHNPYTTDLTSQLRAFNLPPQLSTPLFSGGGVHTTSYPALSFLAYVPFGALFGTDNAFGLITDGLAWVLSMIVLWRLLPAALRPVVPLVASSIFYVDFVDGGVTDPIFLPFLFIALYRWERFVTPGTSLLRRWAGPIALGLACSVKPLPWLVAPFLVAGVALEAWQQGRPLLRTTAAYVAAAVAPFAVLNVPFIVLDAHAWATAALLPVTQSLIPNGQGIVQLPLYLHVGGGNVGLFSIVAGGAVLATFSTFVLAYPRSKRLLPALALLPLFLSSRSLINYFGVLLLVTFVAAAAGDATVAAATRLRPVARRVAAVAAGVGTVVAAAALVATLAAPAPLRLAVTSQQAPADASGGIVISVSATNLTGSTLSPRFAVSAGGVVDPSWRVMTGPASLAPMSGATYTIAAPPLSGSSPLVGPGTVYSVVVLTTHPNAVSTSDWVTAP